MHNLCSASQDCTGCRQLFWSAQVHVVHQTCLCNHYVCSKSYAKSLPNADQMGRAYLYKLPVLSINMCVVSYRCILWIFNKTRQNALDINREHFVCAPRQWETTLHSNVVSHCMGAYTKWSLHIRAAVWLSFLKFPAIILYTIQKTSTTIRSRMSVLRLFISFAFGYVSHLHRGIPCSSLPYQPWTLPAAHTKHPL